MRLLTCFARFFGILTTLRTIDGVIEVASIKRNITRYCCIVKRNCKVFVEVKHSLQRTDANATNRFGDRAAISLKKRDCYFQARLE